jgi:ribonuclease J
VIFRGVPFLADEDGIVDEVRDTVEATLDRAADDEVREISLLQDYLRDDVAEFVYKRLRRRPMVLPVVIEV